MGKTVTDRGAPAVSRGPARIIAPAAARSSTREQLLASTAVRLALQASVLAGLAVAATVPASANPTGGTVVQGAATINQSNPNNTVITQSTDRAAINWQSFSIGATQTTQFIQPSTSSTALNRVLGSDPSMIAGHLTANGNIILINPNGVVFSKGSQVNVNSIVATPADIKDADFMAGKTTFSTPAPAGSSVVNEGTITVNQLGIAALVGPKVVNSGVINAKLGHVVLGGAETFTVDLYGDGLLSFDVGSKAHSPLSVVNDGQVNAQGGTVQITAETADALVTSVVNLGGQINAASGSVTADAGATGQLNVSGTVDVSGKAAGQTGGSATLTGQDVAIESGALIDASGSAGGGTIKVGGGAHGSDATVRNAATTEVAAGATLDASAIDKGNGGKITVWSDQQTNFAGTVKATGGAKGGDGGFAEVSSKGVLGFTGLANLTAPFGKLGTLLLDPSELDVVDGNTNTDTAGVCSAAPVNCAPPPDGTSLLTNTTLDGLLNGATVNLAADTIDFKANVVGTGTLSANATTAIILDTGVSVSNAAGGLLNVALLSGNPEGTVGNITFGANTSILTGGGGLTAIAAGQLTLDPTTLLRTAGGFTTLGAQSLTLPNTIDTGDGGLQLNATTGGITQTGGSITAGFIEGSAIGDVALTQATNSIPFISGFSTGGNFALTTAAPQLTITNTIGGGAGTIAVNVTNGNLQLGQDGIATTFSGTGGTSLNVSGAIALVGNATTNGPTTIVAGTGFASGTVTQGAFTFSTTSNPLTLTTPLLVLPAPGGLNSGSAATTINAPANEGMSVGAAITGTLNVSNADLAQITAGSLTLTTATGNDITVNGATNTATNGNITLQSGGKLSFPGDFTTPNNLDLVAASTITENGGAISATVLSGSAGGDVALNNGRNAIDDLAGFNVTGGAFSFLNSQSLVIVDPVAGVPAISATGNIQVGTLTDTLILGEGPLRLVRPADLRSGTGILLETGSAANGSVIVDGPTTMNAATSIGVDGPQFLVNNTLNTGTNLLTVASAAPMSVGTATEGTLNISDASLGNITAGSLLLTTPGTINVDSVTAHPAIGLVNLSSEAGITFAPVPDLAGGSTAFANGLSAITSAGDIVLGENVSTGPSLFLGAPGATSNIVQQTGGITTTAFSALAGGNIEIFGTTNSIDSIGTLSSTGSFINLQTNAPGHLLTIAGPVTATAASGEVFLQAGGDMTVDGQVNSTTNHVILNSGGALTLTGNAAVAAPASFVDLTSAGLMQINGSVQAPIGSVNLLAQGGLAEGATGSIVTPLLTAQVTGGGAALNSAGNQVAVLGGVFVQGGNFSFVNSTDLIVADIPGDGAPQNAINANTGSINVQVNGGTLTLGRPPQAPGSIEPVTATLLGTGGVTLGASGDINVAGPTTANATTNMTAGGNIGLGANVGITGDLSLVAQTGAVNQTNGRLAISGALTGSSATDTTLTTVGDVAPNNIPTLGNFAAGGTLTLNDGVPLTVAGNVSAGTQITLSATFGEALGGITQNSGTITAPTLDLITSGDVLQNSGNLAIGTLLAQVTGGITLFNGTNSTNAINTIGAVSAGGGIAIQASTPVTVNGPVVANDGLIFLGSTGAMTVTGQVSSLAAGNTLGGVELSAQAGTLTITGNALVNSVDRGVTLLAGGAMQVDGAVEAPKGGIFLASSGVTQANTGSLVAQTLTMDEVGNVTLPSTDNQVGTLTNVHVRQGNFAFVNGTDLTIVDTVQQGTLTPAIDADTGKVNVQVAGTLSLGTPIQDVANPPPTSATIIGTGGITLAATGGDTNVVGATTANGTTSLSGANIGLGNNLGVTGDLQLVASAGSIGQTNGALTVSGTLTGSATNLATLTATTNSVPTLGQFTTGLPLTLVDNVPLTVTGAVSATGLGGSILLTTNGGNPITVAATGSLTANGPTLQLNSGDLIAIDGSIAASAGTVNLLSPSTIAEGPAGSIAAALFTANAAGTVALNGLGNNIALLDGITVQNGNFSLVNAGGLTIADRAIDGPNVTTPAIDVGAGTINVQVTGGGLTFGRTVADAAELGQPTTARLLGAGGVTLGASGDVNVIGTTTLNSTSGITAGGAINLADSLGITGDLQLTAGGAIAQTAGIVTTTGILSGSSGGATSLTTVGNLVPTLGAFTSGGALTLVDNVPLVVTGPVKAGGDIALSSIGQMTLNAGSFVTPGSILFQVGASEGPTQFTQTGTTTFDPQTITINVAPSAFASGSTLLPPPLVSLDNFIAPQANLVLQLGNGKATAANLQVGGLDVIGSGGSATLTGTVAGIGGAPAARLALQSNTPPDPLYQLNNCTIQLGCTPPNSIFNPVDPVIDILAALQASVAHDGVVYLSTGRQKKPYSDPTIDTLNIGSEDLF